MLQPLDVQGTPRPVPPLWVRLSATFLLALCTLGPLLLFAGAAQRAFPWLSDTSLALSLVAGGAVASLGLIRAWWRDSLQRGHASLTDWGVRIVRRGRVQHATWDEITRYRSRAGDTILLYRDPGLRSRGEDEGWLSWFGAVLAWIRLRTTRPPLRIPATTTGARLALLDQLDQRGIEHD
jgi:hypothetical protein